MVSPFRLGVPFALTMALGVAAFAIILAQVFVRRLRFRPLVVGFIAGFLLVGAYTSTSWLAECLRACAQTIPDQQLEILAKGGRFAISSAVYTVIFGIVLVAFACVVELTHRPGAD